MGCFCTGRCRETGRCPNQMPVVPVRPVSKKERAYTIPYQLPEQDDEQIEHDPIWIIDNNPIMVD